MFPIIKNFTSSSILKAFILNALLGALICALAIELRLTLENEKTLYYGFWSNIYNEKKLSIIHKFLATFIITIIVSLLAYHLFYLLFSFGGGQLSNIKIKSANYKQLIKNRI